MRNHPLDGFQRQPLTIRDIRVIPLSYVHPEENLWRSSTYQVWKTDAAITEIITEEGLTGIGEGTPYEGPTYIKKFTEDVIKPLAIGKNPFDVELLTNRGTDSRKNRAPWAGVDAACWDLIGKSLNKPVYELLSGRVWIPHDLDHEPLPLWCSNESYPLRLGQEYLSLLALSHCF